MLTLVVGIEGTVWGQGRERVGGRGGNGLRGRGGNGLGGGGWGMEDGGNGLGDGGWGMGDVVFDFATFPMTRDTGSDADVWVLQIGIVGHRHLSH